MYGRTRGSPVIVSKEEGGGRPGPCERWRSERWSRVCLALGPVKMQIISLVSYYGSFPFLPLFLSPPLSLSLSLSLSSRPRG